MATKLGRKETPSGHNENDFEVVGRASNDQGDFGTEVGCADMACVNQFGEANNSKYYHAAVVKSRKNGKFYTYFEWGRTFTGKSWEGGFQGQDFMFTECSSEAEARDVFSKQCAEKNLKRGEWKTIGSAKVWAAREGKDGYIVQKLATRQRGLPDTYRIKDASGVVAKPATAASPAKKAASPLRAFQSQVISLATALVGGTRSFTKALSAATGVTPTQAAIDEVRNILIPAALGRIKSTGPDITDQVRDTGLRDISKMVAALVPRDIPRSGVTDEEAIMNTGNIGRITQDLDAFEAALNNEDFDLEAKDNTVDPDTMLNAKLTWLDPRAEGKQIVDILSRMSNNRHGNLRGSLKVLNLFKVERPDRDAKFLSAVKTVAAVRKGNFKLPANLQPASRPDLEGQDDFYKAANVILTQHGTRSVNISPIIQTHFRMPKSLSGVIISGANFGYGNYQATDFRKAVGYSSYEGSAWASGSGGVKSRGAFMFLCDTLMGDAYRAPSTGSWDSPPQGKDSVFGVGGDRGHNLQNDEHVVFDPFYTRVRYLVEFTF